MTAVEAGAGMRGAARPWPASTAARLVLGGLGLVVAVAVASVALSGMGAFPPSWNLGLAQPIDEARRWLIANQTSHWLYLGFLNPVADTVDGGIGTLESILAWFPWYAYPVLTGLGLGWTRGPGAAGVGVGGVIVIGLFEVWDAGLETLALMAVSVLFSLLIGIPLGIASARSDRTQRLTRPVLDFMQTMPGIVYFIPAILLFSVGRVPAALATIVYALPPAVRLTDLGLRAVDRTMIEASTMFGATSRQTLVKVALPQALPSILAGVNQTIMMAMGMVVLASLAGAGGLGGLVLNALSSLKVGEAAEAGLAVVIMAILLDRFFSGLTSGRPVPRGRALWAGAGVVAALAVGGGLLGHQELPEALAWHIAPAIDTAVDWAQVNLYFLTGPFSDFVTLELVTPLRELLTSAIPWPVLIAATALVALAVGGWKLALGTAAALFGLGLLGMWELSMDTLSQSIVAVVATLAIGVPLGVVAGRRARVHAVLAPVLDFLQTIPSLVLLVPAVMLFAVGRVPGLLASVLYALPAAVHLTALGLRQVPAATREAAHSFGASSRQRLTQVELPLAAPQIMVAVNQVIMLVMAMVVIAALGGGAGLGLEAVKGLRRSDSVGTGFEAGFAVVLLAVVLDRLTRALADRFKVQPG